MKIGAGIGLAALIISFIGAFIPIVGLIIGWLALGLALIATLFGDKGLSIAVVIWSAFVFMFLTPTLWIDSVRAEETGTSAGLVSVSFLLVIAPVVGMLLHSSGKVALGKRKDVGTI